MGSTIEIVRLGIDWLSALVMPAGRVVFWSAIAGLIGYGVGEPPNKAMALAKKSFFAASKPRLKAPNKILTAITQPRTET